MAALTKVPPGQRYVCDLLAFEAGAKIPAQWRGKGRLVEAPPPRAPVQSAMTWQQRKAAKAIADSDAGFVRVLEDLMDALEAKGVVALADLPPAAAQKITQRRTNRAVLEAKDTPG